MNGYLAMFLYGVFMGGASVAVGYEPRWNVRIVYWGMLSCGVCFAAGWRLYGYFHPGVDSWPFA